MAITASYDSIAQDLTVTGDTASNAITVGRNAGGTLLVNGGAVPVSGGTATVANTDLIEVLGSDGDDTIALDETNGALPAAELVGGIGNDAATGGSGADSLYGEAGNDTLLGRGGLDTLDGGDNDDTLAGGDGNDQMFGGPGNDRMIWNPGDDSDLMEGGDGSDTAQVNGGNGAEVFTATANGTRVRFDRLDPAPFTLDIGTTESLVVNMNGGDDSFSATGNLAALIGITVDGGAGNDTILGSNGADLLIGGDGNDLIDGQQGADVAFLGVGNDVFQWDPGDGSDVVEGQDGIDQLRFNGSGASEVFNISANGGRARLTRDVGNVVQDLDGLEVLTINALGGADTLTVNDLMGTDVMQVDVSLAGTLGGSAGDAQLDSIVANGNDSANAVTITGSGTGVSISGFSALINITNAEAANDSLRINGLGGGDTITAATLSAGIVSLIIDGGLGNDTIAGSGGADTILGGDGNDVIDGNQGTDAAFLGIGDDQFRWDPGDASDVVEGQAGTDELFFNGSNASEDVSVAANGGRILFTRNVAAIAMDLDDVERIRFNAIGGADNILVNDLTGTDVIAVDVHLAASGGGGDGAVDTVTVNGTGVNDTVTVASSGGVVTVSGLPATTSLFGAEGANDRLVLYGFAGDDVIDASGLQAGLLGFTVVAGLGADVIVGSAGNDLVSGNDGNDTALLGAGNDTFAWNPGDDNDTIEGQSGSDTLQFNGSNVAESIQISANGGRVIFFRDVAAVTMDLNDTETIQFAALGGADSIVVNDLAGTDLTQVAIDLASVIGGASGDAQVDTITLVGTGAANGISLSGSATALTVSGLPWSALISQIETTDRLNILAGDGNDSVSTAGIAKTLTLLTIDGGGGNDTLQSTGNGDYFGGTGDDRILAGLTSSSEVLDGGAGIDTLDTRTFNGSYNIDMVTGVTDFVGESFTNFENLITGLGADTITGTAGANTIRTTGGIDAVAAGDGNDTIEGGADGDTLDGGAGIDTLDYSTSSGGVTVSLASGAASGGHAAGDSFTGFENLTGSALADMLTGDAGNNTLNGLAGADTMAGGSGNDNYYVNSSTDVVNEAAGQGTDRIFASSNYILAAGVSVETLSTAATLATTAITLVGNELANNIYGNYGNNSLFGSSGNDTLIGHNGDDTLNGGLGTDTMSGGLGNDNFYVDTSTDTVSEAAGQGTDRIFTTSNYVLGAGVSIETLSTDNAAGTAAITLIGNELANNVYGNYGNNSLYGSSGNDTLIAHAGNDLLNGGAGADSLTGGAGADTFVFANAAGPGNIDSIGDYVVADDVIHIDNAVFTGLPAGTLAAGAFRTGAAAVDADDRIIYNNATGALFFDADGNGAGAAVQFATLSTGLAMSAGEFFVI